MHIEYDDLGNYRICQGFTVKGEWTPYQMVAKLGNYVAFSDYWGEPLANCIYELCEEKVHTAQLAGRKPE